MLSSSGRSKPAGFTSLCAHVRSGCAQLPSQGLSGASVLFTTTDGCEDLDGTISTLERVVTVDGGDDDAVDGETTVDGYDAVTDHSDAFDSVETHPNDPYTLTYTSGTTGAPKGVLSSHRGVVELHAYAEYVADVRPDDVYLVAASPSWSYGLNMGTVMSGVRGTAIGCYRGQFDPHTFFETLEEGRRQRDDSADRPSSGPCRRYRSRIVRHRSPRVDLRGRVARPGDGRLV